MINTAFIYIHIPFCRQKCNYCSFCSYATDSTVANTLVEDYLNSLAFEINNELLNDKNMKVKTIYIGGGTPNLLSINQLSKVITPINKLNFDNNYEFTIECNPETLTYQYLRELKQIGINRISIGAQSFNDKILATIGRKHNAKKIFQAVESAHKAEFNNISLDLMYGLPFQNIDIWNTTLDTILTLDINHISLYGLKIEKSTPTYDHYLKNNTLYPDDDMQADMFLLANKKLTSSSYKHYEISNYSKPEKESIHNINYWKNDPYYGFGCSACGYLQKIRYFNTTSINKYISDYKPHRQMQTITDKENIDNTIMLGLRLTEGINLESFKLAYNIDFIKQFAITIDKYKDFLEISDNRINLNLQGMLLSNYIISEFINL